MAEVVANSLTDPTTSLAGAISADDTALDVAAWASPLPTGGTFRLRIDNELIEVGSVSGTTLGDLLRGVEGTVAASHLNGAGVSIVLTAGGLAAFTRPIVADTDPGAVGAGAIWVNTTEITGTTCRPISVRNADNDDWIPNGLAVYTDGVQRAFVTLNSDGGIAIESKDVAGALQSMVMMASNGVTIRALVGLLRLEGLAVEASGPFTFNDDVLMPFLPTSDPGVAAELWNSAGTLKISAG